MTNSVVSSGKNNNRKRERMLREGSQALRDGGESSPASATRTTVPPWRLPFEQSREFEDRVHVMEVLADYVRLKHGKGVETVAKLFVAGAALVYATGFLVVYTFLARWGIRETGDFFKAKYMHVGMLYWLLPGLLGLPLYAFFSSKRRHDVLNADLDLSRTKAPAIRLSSMAMVSQLLITLYTVTLMSPPQFLHNRILCSIYGYNLRALYVVALNFIITIGGISSINSVAKRVRGWRRRANLSPFRRGLRVLSWCPFPGRNNGPLKDFRALRAAMFTAVVLLDVLCLWPLSRLIYDMMKRGIVVGLAFMLAGVVIWRFEDHLSKQSNPDPLDRRDIMLIGTAIITGCYLFSTIGFALTIYPFVPAERGGGNYFHSPNIALDLGDASGFPEDLLQPREVSEKAVEPVSVRVYEPSQLQGFVQNRTAKSQVRRSLPLKLLEQTSAWIYVAPPKGADSFADWHPRIIAVKATAVSEIENLDSDCKTDCER